MRLREASVADDNFFTIVLMNRRVAFGEAFPDDFCVYGRVACPKHYAIAIELGASAGLEVFSSLVASGHWGWAILFRSSDGRIMKQHVFGE